jgi:hypothetical protein
VPGLDEPIAVTRIIDRDRHSDEIGELAARPIERPVDEREAGPRLSFEIVHYRFSVQVGKGGRHRLSEITRVLAGDCYARPQIVWLAGQIEGGANRADTRRYHAETFLF